jgi:hypothetical protein
MDAVNATILKTTIEAIPVLTEENFSTWKLASQLFLN